ncbi:MAG: DNA repair protein RecN [Alcaligenaceae bacterium]|jgi:DNA repair protein RecN (Recombination protein N)|nr:DNA repair protein RecN [Alcaligenaceae bacterium]
MLSSLHIRDFVIVEKTDLHFEDGFTVFSGETGAGKSILIDALSLALGGRTDAGVVREGTERAEISAIFDTGDTVKQWLKDNDFESDELIVRRIITNQAKSRSFINGSPCTLTQLKELGEMLVDIHGQHQHQNLLKNTAQRQLLDAHAQIGSKLRDLHSHWQLWQTNQQKLNDFLSNEQQRKLEQEHLQWQWQELNNLKPQSDEWEQVDQSFNRLSNAATLLAGAGTVAELIDGEEHSVISALNRCLQQISQLVKHDPSLESIATSLESARISCVEAGQDLNRFLDDVELDPQRLAETERRMRQLFDAAKKFNTEPENLHLLLEDLEKRLADLEFGMDTESLKLLVEQNKHDYMELAEEISIIRKQTAKELSEKVTELMQTLAMQGGRFEIEVQASTPSAHGLDQIQFNVAGHAGTTPRALNKIASGGELARISLALSVIANKAGQVPTLIFDEVDTGIGGGVAEIVGRLLRQLGENHQVLCVTHLAQVASCAHQHFEVRKKEQSGMTRSDILALSEEQRVQEIARMLGGLNISETTLRHAEEMLKH